MCIGYVPGVQPWTAHKGRAQPWRSSVAQASACRLPAAVSTGSRGLEPSRRSAAIASRERRERRVIGLEAMQAWVTCLLILYHRRGRIASPCCGLFQAVAHLLAVEGETPMRSAHTRQVTPERRQRRIRWPLDSVAHRSSSSGNSSSASRQAVVVVIIGLGRDGLQVGVRSHALHYSIGQPIATTRHKLNIYSQSRQQ